MTYPTELFQRAWQRALSSILHQHQWAGHFKDSLFNYPQSGLLLDHTNNLIKCPCLMTHALFSSEMPVKKRKRKRRKKRKISGNRNKVSILHSVRYGRSSPNFTLQNSSLLTSHFRSL